MFHLISWIVFLFLIDNSGYCQYSSLSYLKKWAQYLLNWTFCLLCDKLCFFSWCMLYLWLVCNLNTYLQQTNPSCRSDSSRSFNKQKKYRIVNFDSFKGIVHSKLKFQTFSMSMEALLTFHQGKGFHQMPKQWKSMVAMYSNLKKRKKKATTKGKHVSILLMWCHPSVWKPEL